MNRDHTITVINVMITILVVMLLVCIYDYFSIRALMIEDKIKSEEIERIKCDNIEMRKIITDMKRNVRLFDGFFGDYDYSVYKITEEVNKSRNAVAQTEETIRRLNQAVFYMQISIEKLKKENKQEPTEIKYVKTP